MNTQVVCINNVNKQNEKNAKELELWSSKKKQKINQTTKITMYQTVSIQDKVKVRKYVQKITKKFNQPINQSLTQQASVLL